MTRLLLIRHGRSTWNADKRIQGQADPPLDEVGREQARRLAERLRGDPPVALYTSPLQRARETAEIVGQALDVPVVPDGRLKEYDVGAITGLTWEQVVEQHPDVAHACASGAPDCVNRRLAALRRRVPVIQLRDRRVQRAPSLDRRRRRGERDEEERREYGEELASRHCRLPLRPSHRNTPGCSWKFILPEHPARCNYDLYGTGRRMAGAAVYVRSCDWWLS